MTKNDSVRWAVIREGASVCVDGAWTKWPPSHKYLKTACKVESIVRKRTRMRLKVHGLAVLAWFHDLKIIDMV